MKHIEHGRPIEFIRHRRETRGYQKITRDREGLLGTYTTSSIQKVEGATE